MSHENHKPGHDGAPPLRLVGEPFAAGDQPTPTETGNDSPQRLLHELSNLLDGSLRSVGLALSGIDDAAQAGTVDSETREHLANTSLALRQMAELLSQQTPGHDADLASAYEHDRTLGEVIAHAMKVLSPVAGELEIDLTAEVGDDVADRASGRVYPVLINGMRNAIEAVGRDGAVRVEAHRAGDDLELRITDTGCGVSPALPRDHDGLVAPGVTTKPRGQGLGLAISRDIVRAMGGVIRLEDGEHHGAVLIIRLPMD